MIEEEIGCEEFCVHQNILKHFDNKLISDEQSQEAAALFKAAWRRDAASRYFTIWPRSLCVSAISAFWSGPANRRSPISWECCAIYRSCRAEKKANKSSIVFAMLTSKKFFWRVWLIGKISICQKIQRGKTSFIRAVYRKNQGKVLSLRKNSQTKIYCLFWREVYNIHGQQYKCAFKVI